MFETFGSSPTEGCSSSSERRKVVRVLVPEVGLLRRVARAGTDVAALDRDRAERLQKRSTTYFRRPSEPPDR